MAEPITPATLGPMACMSRKLPGLAFWPSTWLTRAAIGTADASVYTLDGRPQPLFGLYRRTCLPEAAGMLAVGENKLQLLLDRVATVYLPTADPDPFRNLNTPEELERARRSVWL